MSGFFVWNHATLGLNVPEMDGEHQILIGLMNTLHDLYERRAPRAELAKALDELIFNTGRHFANEEAYMSRVDIAASIATRRLSRSTRHRKTGSDERTTPRLTPFPQKSRGNLKCGRDVAWIGNRSAVLDAAHHLALLTSVIQKNWSPEQSNNAFGARLEPSLPCSAARSVAIQPNVSL